MSNPEAKRSTTKKALAAITAAGLLSLGGTSVAFAADGSTGSSDPAASTAARHPNVRRGVLRTAFSAAAAALGMSNQELRAAVLDGPRSISDVAGGNTDAVAAAVSGALNDALDQAVADGRVSEARADRARARIPQFTQRFVTHVPQPRAT